MFVKRIFFIAIAITFCMGLALAQGERGKSVLSIGGGKATLDYGRPAIKGRTIEALPGGRGWRRGTEDATPWTSDVNLRSGDKVIQKGPSVLKAKRAYEKDWVLITQSEDESSKV